MPRTKKERIVCECLRHIAEKSTNDPKGIGMSLDELESLRLADLEQLDQAESATRMGVSRGTFQRLLYEARRKSALALVSGSSIHIEHPDTQGDDTFACRCDTEGKCRYCGRAMMLLKNSNDNADERSSTPCSSQN